MGSGRFVESSLCARCLLWVVINVMVYSPFRKVKKKICVKQKGVFRTLVVSYLHWYVQTGCPMSIYQHSKLFWVFATTVTKYLIAHVNVESINSSKPSDDKLLPRLEIRLHSLTWSPLYSDNLPITPPCWTLKNPPPESKPYINPCVLRFQTPCIYDDGKIV